MNKTTDRILEQGKALVRAIEALATVEPTGPIERVQVWFLLQAYRRRLRAIVELAPKQMAEEIVGAGHRIGGGRTAIWMTGNRVQGRWNVRKALSLVVLAAPMLALLGSACGAPLPEPTATPVRTNTPLLTVTWNPGPTHAATPLPTDIATPSPTQTPTKQPTPTENTAPTSTPEREPTATEDTNTPELTPVLETTPESEIEKLLSSQSQATVTINGEQGEYILLDPEPGEALDRFDSNAAELGWAQTPGGEWVIFNESTQVAIKTMPKKELDRLGLNPRLEKEDGFYKDGSESDSLEGYGFFIGHEERNMVLNPDDAEQRTGRVTILRFFIPAGNRGGTVAETFVFGDPIERKFVLALEFREPSRTETEAGVVTADEGLSRLSIGDTTKFSCPYSMHSLYWGDRQGFELEQDMRTFIEQHAGMEEKALRRYQEGTNETILLGAVSWVNYFPRP